MFLRRFWNESLKKRAEIDCEHSFEDKRLMHNTDESVYIPPIALIMPKNNNKTYSMISIIKQKQMLSDKAKIASASSTQNKFLGNCSNNINKNKRSRFLRLASLKNIQLPFKVFSISVPSILFESLILKTSFTDNSLKKCNYLNVLSTINSNPQISITHHSTLSNIPYTNRRLLAGSSVKFSDKIKYLNDQHQKKKLLITGFF